mmetsp:Transcript_32758/g.91748  ORF Transcript_32758/g.91748 Transcript_32758/m.91748 type:complete len:177 (+) Transcript_32758:851-1381(+)
MFSCSLAHMGLPHLLGNLLAIWLFSFKLARVIGTVPYISLWTLGALAASGTQVLASAAAGRTIPVPSVRERLDETKKTPRRSKPWFERVREVLVGPSEKALKEKEKETRRQQYIAAHMDVPMLGASGSAMALAGAAAVLFPRDKVITRFVPFPIRYAPSRAGDRAAPVSPVPCPSR